MLFTLVLYRFGRCLQGNAQVKPVQARIKGCGLGHYICRREQHDILLSGQRYLLVGHHRSSESRQALYTLNVNKQGDSAFRMLHSPSSSALGKDKPRSRLDANLCDAVQTACGSEICTAIHAAGWMHMQLACG